MTFYSMEMLLKHFSNVHDWGLSDAMMGSDHEVVPKGYNQRLASHWMVRTSILSENDLYGICHLSS